MLAILSLGLNNPILQEGERLYEEILNESEGIKLAFHKNMGISKKFDNVETAIMMKEMVPKYKSNNSVYEVLDNKYIV